MSKTSKADIGTENVHVEAIQKFFRRHHQDEHAGERSFLYGKSINNQRIESLWGMIRRQGIQIWMNVFQGLAESGFHNAENLDQEITCFCFLQLVQVRTQFKIMYFFANCFYQVLQIVFQYNYAFLSMDKNCA